MHRHCYHWLNFSQVDIYTSVIISYIGRRLIFKVLASAVNIIPCLYVVICNPYGRKTCCFGCHNVNAVSVVCTEVCYAVTYKFHYFILYISVFEHSTYNCKGYILRTYVRSRFSRKIYSHYLRHINIVCFVEELFNKLRTAFAHSHCSQSTITCMAVGAKYHFAYTTHHFTHILVNNSLMCRYIYSAVLFGTA